ncbi:MAG: hypothetical protein EA409_05530 [Saprospirales bacterium]|nr:MAG: hypothetical protein EA409_05530 [Saprospirales bacterium]
MEHLLFSEKSSFRIAERTENPIWLNALALLKYAGRDVNRRYASMEITRRPSSDWLALIIRALIEYLQDFENIFPDADSTNIAAKIRIST